MPWPDRDEDLIELARSDPEAFGELYQRHLTKVYSYVYYRTGRRQDAEDLTERTFLQALTHLPRYKQMGVPFSAWLMRIAHNLVSNWYRDNRRPLVPIDEAHGLSNPEEDPHEAAEAREEKRALLAVVAQLSAERQQLLLLRFVEGMRAAEIATVMGRSEGAVKALLHRTLISLRKRLESPGRLARTEETTTLNGR